MYLPTKEKALKEANYSVDALKGQEETSYAELIEYTVPDMTKELLCSILNSQGGRFAEEQKTIREWEIVDGKVKSKTHKE